MTSINSLYEAKMPSLTGTDVDFAQYQGKVVLVVNTASKCGLTPQYEGLQALHTQFHGQGLEILGFPCNQFGKQEPGSHTEIGAFCQANYGVDFSMFEKIDVNGDNTAPLYQWLKNEAPGLLGSKAIKWNFTKFLIGRDGKVIKRFAPTDSPESLTQDIEKALATSA